MPQGRYITQADVTGVFGAQPIAAWAQSDPAQHEPYPDQRIEQAIDHAEREVESRFRGSGYAVPLAGPDEDDDGDMSIVRRWMATLAGLWLASTREVDDEKDQLGKMRKDVELAISTVLAGPRTLALKTLTVSTTPNIVSLEKQQKTVCDPFTVQ